MSFLWPFMLFLLLFIPVLILAYLWAQRRRHQYAVRYASLSLVKEALGRGPGIRRHIPPAFFLLSLATMIFALARPQAVVRLPAQEGIVVLTIDVSGSMNADDLHPNRMEAAKAAARAFVERQPESVQIGVVSFSDNAFIVQQPTTDQDAVLAAIDRLTPQRGTAIGRGILSSLQAIFDLPASADAPNRFSATPTVEPTPVPKGTYAPAIIVLLSDGENNQFPDPIEVAEEAAKRGVRIYTIGVGSPEGTILRIQGRAIRTRLDEAALRQVAELTDGTYYSASNEEDLRKIYENLGTRLVFKTEKTEITAAFTGAAVILSLIGGILSLLWFNRLP